MPRGTVYSVCPHDCPSVCALAVERLDTGPAVRIHPADLAALGIADGAAVRLGNRRGSVVVPARAFDGVQRGVVVAEGIWPNHAIAEGIGINVLTSADPGLPNGGAVYHDTAVWVRPAPG